MTLRYFFAIIRSIVWLLLQLLHIPKEKTCCLYNVVALGGFLSQPPRECPEIGKNQNSNHPVQGHFVIKRLSSQFGNEPAGLQYGLFRSNNVGIGALQLFPLSAHLFQGRISDAFGFHSEGQTLPKHAFGTSNQRFHVCRIVSASVSPALLLLVKELFSVAVVQGPGHLSRERKDVPLNLLGGLSDFHGISFHFRQTLHGRRVLFGLCQESLAFLEGRSGAGAGGKETPNAGQAGIVFLYSAELNKE